MTESTRRSSKRRERKEACRSKKDSERKVRKDVYRQKQSSVKRKEVCCI